MDIVFDMFINTVKANILKRVQYGVTINLRRTGNSQKSIKWVRIDCNSILMHHSGRTSEGFANS